MKINKIKKISADEDGPIDVMGGDDDVAPEEDLGGDLGMDDMGGGGLEGEGMGLDSPDGMGGEQAPQIDYDGIFMERTHDLEKVLENEEDFDIDYSRLT